ncbi:MAG: LLM class flavin-dependent oxidoreductase [Candidatus Dormibacterales bacterium]
MRLGLTLPPEDVPASEIARVSRRAESLGYEEAWSYERNFFDAFTPLAAAAPATSRLRLGTSIVPALTRPAGLLAMSAASLADLAPGRFTLGLGVSTEAVVSGWMGLEWSRPVERTKEALVQVRALLAGERSGAFRLHRPPEAPVPIYLAALGPRMLRLAGELADGVLLFMAGPGVVPEVSRHAGRPMDTVARVVTVTGSSRTAGADFAHRFIAFYATLPFYSRFLSGQGFQEEVAAIGRLWRDGDRAGAAGQVSEAMTRALVWVAADPAAGELADRFAAAGLGCLDLWFMSPAESPEERRRDLEHALTAFKDAARRPAPAGGE